MRAALERFWRRVSSAATLSPVRRGPLDMLLGNWTLDNSPMFIAMDMASRVFSPYDLGVAAFNPLRNILAENIDFGRLRKSQIKIFITAANVQTGRGAVVTVLAVCGATHKASYLDIVVAAMVGPMIALAAVILLGSLFGSF